MPTPSSNPNEPSKFRRILNANNIDDSIAARLPRAQAVTSTSGRGSLIDPPAPPDTAYAAPRNGCLPMFWTFASILSMIVNFILIGIVIFLLLNLRTAQGRLDQATSMISTLYGSFAAMDNATIMRTIPVNAKIPLDLTVPVTLTGQRIVLTQDTPLVARVEIHEGGLDLVETQARITLYRDQPLIVDLAQFNLPVKNEVPVNLNVDVKIPLNQTELHEPFFNLQQMVQPYLCMLDSHATFRGGSVCR